MQLSAARSRWLLIVLALLPLARVWQISRFEPVIEIDSASYLDFDWSSVTAILSSHRTLGYPLFLRAVRCLTSDPRAIVVAHWFALLIASLVFLESLVLAGFRRETAAGAAAALLFGRTFLELGRAVTADSLACALAIATTGCFLASCRSQPPLIAWCGVSLGTFATYLTRPAFLFLIPLWPLVTFFADRWIVARGSSWTGTLRRAAIQALLTGVPFMLFCTLRWGVTGHWGLVSFGGYNLIGIVGQFLDEPTVRALPDDLQPVAQAMLSKAEKLPGRKPPDSFLAMETMYNPTIWQVAVPTVREFHGEHPPDVNRVLSKLSRDLLQRHWRGYLRWLSWNGLHGIKQVVQLTLTDTSTRLILVLLLLAQCVWLRRGPQPGAIPPDDANNHAARVRFLECQLVFWTAILFAAAKWLLVILVEPANDRYMAAAELFLPAVIAVFAAQVLRNPVQQKTLSGRSHAAR